MKLGDFKGRKLLLYFFPKANTPNYTTQAMNIRDAKSAFSRLGVNAIGISPDLWNVQQTFDKKQGLGFPLLSDPDQKAADAYGIWGEKSMYGKKYEGIRRF